jgi:prepilin-type N-terminal cleavage/methylation domain-containing protein
MKIPTIRCKSGFTLVELLVVIAIIAVLASAGFAAGNAAIQKAKKVTCLATATALEGAVNNFYTEYGSLPSNATSDTKVSTDTDTNLITVLLGLETTTPPLNTRAVKFLQVREGKNKKNGLIYSTSGISVSGLYDAWGGGYKVMMDCDYDEKVTTAPSAGGGATLNGRRVAVWSDGADGTKGGGKITDDVKTW